MHYFIDGYNLMFRFFNEDDELRAQREMIIEDLNTKSLDLNVTLVFDAQYQSGEMSRSHYQNLEILFSAQGETADDLILEEIARELRPRQVVVVTSDKKLAWFARRCSAKTESVEQFMDWLNRRYKNQLRAFKKAKPPLPKHPSPIKEEGEKAPSVLPLAPVLPTAQASPEECFDYYLDRFQKELDAAAQNLPKKLEQKSIKPTHPKRKGKKPPEEPIQDHIARWLEIFERKLNEEE